MSLLTKMDKIAQVLSIAEDATEFAGRIARMVRQRRWRAVDKILAGELKTSMARAVAYAKAAERFDADEAAAANPAPEEPDGA